MKDGKLITLAIESSCDETAAAVMADGREALSSIISSQIDIHKQYGRRCAGDSHPDTISTM